MPIRLWLSIATLLSLPGERGAFSDGLASATPTLVAQSATPVIASGSVDAAMKMFNRSLGVECAFCHVDKDWKDSSKPQWATARNMWRMVQALNTDALANTNGITCMTCHGGRNKPERLPAQSWQALADKWPTALSDDRKLAMSVYSASLGVGCEHCHDPADWTSTTTPAFATAQRMNAMFEVFPRFMPAGARTQCYMCHKGAKRPAGSH